MIQGLGCKVEYGRGSFNKEHVTQEVMEAFWHMSRTPGALEPAYAIALNELQSAFGVLLQLVFTVWVPSGNDARADVEVFLTRFEQQFRSHPINTDYRSIDGELVPIYQAAP